MSKKYDIPEIRPQMANEPAVAYPVKPMPLHLDITLEDNAMVADIKKAIQMIKGIASVKILPAKQENVITPSLAKKIEKARKDFAEGRYTECKTKEELEAFLEAL
jgi:copper chaperone CopZ